MKKLFITLLMVQCIQASNDTYSNGYQGGGWDGSYNYSFSQLEQPALIEDFNVQWGSNSLSSNDSFSGNSSGNCIEDVIKTYDAQSTSNDLRLTSARTFWSSKGTALTLFTGQAESQQGQPAQSYYVLPGKTTHFYVNKYVKNNGGSLSESPLAVAADTQYQTLLTHKGSEQAAAYLAKLLESGIDVGVQPNKSEGSSYWVAQKLEVTSSPFIGGSVVGQMTRIFDLTSRREKVTYPTSKDKALAAVDWVGNNPIKTTAVATVAVCVYRTLRK